MRWLLFSCLLGGLGAWLRQAHWPYADWVNLAGFGVLVIGLLLWLKAARTDWSGKRGETEVARQAAQRAEALAALVAQAAASAPEDADARSETQPGAAAVADREAAQG